jgi:serine/threonine protein phosphatase 1
MRTLAIGDIHGCLRALAALVHAVKPHPDDLLITLGDYVDRGPNSRGVLDYLIDLYATGRLVPLRGNHDQMMVHARDDYPGREMWFNCGGVPTLQSYGISTSQEDFLSEVPERHWQFLEHDCVNWYETATHFFVHANVYPDVPLAEQPEFQLLWEKWTLETSVPHCSGKVMVCGHTRQKNGLPASDDHAICIDTGAYAGGWLTCLEVETDRYWQANEQGDVRKGRLDSAERTT